MSLKVHWCAAFQASFQAALTSVHTTVLTGLDPISYTARVERVCPSSPWSLFTIP